MRSQRVAQFLESDGDGVAVVEFGLPLARKRGVAVAHRVRPAFQIGCVSDAMTEKIVDGPSNRSDSSPLSLPSEPVSEMLGK